VTSDEIANRLELSGYRCDPPTHGPGRWNNKCSLIQNGVSYEVTFSGPTAAIVDDIMAIAISDSDDGQNPTAAEASAFYLTVTDAMKGINGASQANDWLQHNLNEGNLTGDPRLPTGDIQTTTGDIRIDHSRDNGSLVTDFFPAG
jgi:hypothetical protein